MRWRVKKVIVIDTPVEHDKMAKCLKVVKKGIQAGRDNLQYALSASFDRTLRL